jgi:hypothetical protein
LSFLSDFPPSTKIYYQTPYRIIDKFELVIGIGSDKKTSCIFSQYQNGETYTVSKLIMGIKSIERKIGKKLPLMIGSVVTSQQVYKIEYYKNSIILVGFLEKLNQRQIEDRQKINTS